MINKAQRPRTSALSSSNLQDGIWHDIRQGYKLTAVVCRTNRRGVLFAVIASNYTYAADNSKDGKQHP